MTITNDTSVLQHEIEFFESKKQDWLKLYKNQFVLVKDYKLAGIYSAYQDAVNAGFTQFGNQPFLVKQVADQEPLAQIPALFVGAIHAHL